MRRTSRFNDNILKRGLFNPILHHIERCKQIEANIKNQFPIDRIAELFLKEKSKKYIRLRPRIKNADIRKAFYRHITRGYRFQPWPSPTFMRADAENFNFEITRVQRHRASEKLPKWEEIFEKQRHDRLEMDANVLGCARAQEKLIQKMMD